jgi:hypothetical protein
MLFFAGCASIVSGTHQNVSFDSTPTGADIVIDNKVVGRTPATVNLKRKNDEVVTFVKEGYKNYTVSMSNFYSYNPMVLGDFILGGPFGTTTDVTDGAIYRYDPTHHEVILVKEGTNPTEAAPIMPVGDKIRSFVIVSYRQIIEDLQKGHGEYLSSLLDELKTPTDQREEMIKRIKGLSEAYPDIPVFADHVVELAPH